MNAVELSKIETDQDSINEILRNDNVSEEGIVKLWQLVGDPQTEAVSLVTILQNLAAVALGQYHPLGAKMSIEELEKFLTRQSFTLREIATLKEKMGLVYGGEKKTLASIITRMVKAITRPRD